MVSLIIGIFGIFPLIKLSELSTVHFWIDLLEIIVKNIDFINGSLELNDILR